jgi:hypothetical protein
MTFRLQTCLLLILGGGLLSDFLMTTPLFA